MLAAPTQGQTEFQVKFQVFENCAVRCLTDEELISLNILASPAWVYKQHHDAAVITWANHTAKTAYWSTHSPSLDTPRRSSLDKKPSGKTVLELLAKVENDGCSMHVTGPRRTLLPGGAGGSNQHDDDEEVTLVISPVTFDNCRGALIEQRTLLEVPGATQFRGGLAIKPHDSVFDVIMRMLELAATGQSVPVVHAKMVHEILLDGASLHQPIMLAKSFEQRFGPNILASGAARNLSRITEMLHIAPRTIGMTAISSLGLCDVPDEVSETSETSETSEQPCDGSPDASPEANGSVASLASSMASATSAVYGSCESKHLPNVVCNNTQEPTAEDLLRYSHILDEWDFDAFKYDDRMLLSMLCMCILTRHDLFETLKLPRIKFWRFIQSVNGGYNSDNPYHNSMHAASVVHAMYITLTRGGIARRLSRCEQDYQMILLVGCVAAAIHDYEHAGVSNDLLIELMTPLAVIYNDTSPQEQHHSASAFYMILHNPDMNFLENFAKGQLKVVRNLIIRMILHTDMKQHFGVVTLFKNRASTNPTWSDDETDIGLALEMVLKCADVSHTSYVWSTHLKWVHRVQEEFFAEGDIQRLHGLPVSPLCDKSTCDLAASQVDFFECIINNMFTVFANAFPDTAPMLVNVMSNYCEWKNRAASAQGLLDNAASAQGLLDNVA
jgi:hypothetical protein